MRIKEAFHRQSVFRDEKNGIWRTVGFLERDLPFLPAGRAGDFHGVDRGSIEPHSVA